MHNAYGAHASSALLFTPPDAVADNAQLRKELADALHLLAERDLENQRERGAVEYELELCQKRSADVVADFEKKLSRCHAENECLKNDLRQLNESLKHQTSELQARDGRIEQLETYLVKLPTAEEHSTTLTQLQETRQRVANLEKSLESSREQLEHYEERLGELNAQLRRSTEREQLLQTQLDGAMSALSNQTENPNSAHAELYGPHVYGAHNAANVCY
ncbi:unnamed protein product [Dicrocoelium dendriticum]|nr:unnamed protein product [Dicrocoelium dendriticum]